MFKILLVTISIFAAVNAVNEKARVCSNEFLIGVNCGPKGEECPPGYKCLISPFDANTSVCCEIKSSCNPACKKAERCVVTTNPCLIPPCPVEAYCETTCPQVKCIACPDGSVNEIDKNGCQTCNCIPA